MTTHPRENVPLLCPACNARSDRFVPGQEAETIRYRCGYTYKDVKAGKHVATITKDSIRLNLEDNSTKIGLASIIPIAFGFGAFLTSRTILEEISAFLLLLIGSVLTTGAMILRNLETRGETLHSIRVHLHESQQALIGIRAEARERSDHDTTRERMGKLEERWREPE